MSATQEEEARALACLMRQRHPWDWPALLLPLRGEAEYVESRLREADPSVWAIIILAGLERSAARGAGGAQRAAITASLDAVHY